MKIFNLVLLSFLTLFLSCAKKSNLNPVLLNKAQSFLGALQTANPEVKYSIAKLTTRKEGWVVFGQTAGDGKTKYYAFDLNNYQAGDDLTKFIQSFESNPLSPYGVLTTSPTLDIFPGIKGLTLIGDFPITYPDPDLTYVFEETSSSGKDLEKVGNIIEGMEKEQIVEILNVNLGLSVSRAEELASVFNSYQKLLKKRSLTESEYGQLTRRVLGTDFTQVKEAMGKYSAGDESSLTDLIDQAAAFNGTNPENLKEFILGLLNRS